MQPSQPAQRGCLLFVIQTTDSMTRPIPTLRGMTGWTAARRLTEGVLTNLVAKEQTSADVWDVAVMADDGRLRCLLPGGSDDRPFVPLSKLAGSQPVRLNNAEVVGTGSPGGLGRAALLLQGWLLAQPRPLQPILVYCGDEQGLGRGLAFMGQSLRILRTPPDRWVLAVCGFTPEIDRSVKLPCVIGDVAGACWRSAWKISSGGTTPRGEIRFLAVNDFSPHSLVQRARKAASQRSGLSSSWRLGGGLPVPCESRVLWAPKDGNSDEEYEDAFAIADDRAVIADGASQGIFAKVWADLLARRFLDVDPDLAAPDPSAGWLPEARSEWRVTFGYDSLHPMQQDKVDDTGAAATLAALCVRQAENGHRWRAAALGDSCLFWIRGGRVLATFPLCRSADFGIAPDLVPTVKRFAPQVRFVTAEGVGKPGDLYGLATDAVAQHLLQSLETEQPIDWQRLWDMDDNQWRMELQRLRAQRRIVNDDSTLVLMRPGN